MAGLAVVPPRLVAVLRPPTVAWKVRPAANGAALGGPMAGTPTGLARQVVPVGLAPIVATRLVLARAALVLPLALLASAEMAVEGLVGDAAAVLDRPRVQDVGDAGQDVAAKGLPFPDPARVVNPALHP